MSEDERSYFQARAEEEIEAAQVAAHPDAARAHYLLAGYYLDFAYNPDAVLARRAPCGEARDLRKPRHEETPTHPGRGLILSMTRISATAEGGRAVALGREPRQEAANG